ncbi:MAG: PASTA domain-containing protein [Actinobacteria bacterium]|nr:PASTA domain-containing protein [Actinomycetota bacterium]
MPGDPLPQPVRVAVRNGGVLLPGAVVRFDASDGGRLAAPGPPTSADPSTLVGVTGADGVARVRWLPHPAGPTTQTLTARRLDDHAQPVDVPVVVTGRLSVAREVAWDPDPNCRRFAGTRTVQDALSTLVARRELRLLGGDGQSVGSAGAVVQRPVRVVVDDGCGPVAGATVQVLAGNEFTGFGRVAPARDGDLAPATLEGTGATERAEVTTDRDGVAEVWWQPSFGNVRWATLDAVLERSGDAPVRVTANLDIAGEGGRTPGLHIRGLRLGAELPFTNDDVVGVDELASGILVVLDGPVAASSIVDKPVIRVELDLPYPIGIEREVWGSGPVGTRTLTLDGTLRPRGESIFWVPRPETRVWLLERLFPVLAEVDVKVVLGRYVLDGWAIVAEEDPRRHVNTHANTVVLAAMGRTLFDLPTDDETTGGQFVQWFHLMRDVQRVRMDPPAVTGRTAAVAQRELEAAGLVVEVSTEPNPDVRKGLVVRTEPAAGTVLDPGSTVRVVVSSGRAG